MVGHVQETVFLLYFLDETLGAVQFFFQNRGPLRVFQVFPSAIGEAHHVFVILIASTVEYYIQAIEIHLFQHAFQQVFGHLGVVDEAQGFAPLTAFHSFRNLLQSACAQVVVNLHFSVTGELESISFKVGIAQPLEYQRKAATDDIVYIHQVAFSVMVGQADETSTHINGQFKESIIGT